MIVFTFPACKDLLCNNTSLIPRPLPVSNVARKKRESLGCEITCAALGAGQENESGQGYEKWTAKRSDIEKQSASVLRILWDCSTDSQVAFRQAYSGHFFAISYPCSALVFIANASLFEGFRM